MNEFEVREIIINGEGITTEFKLQEVSNEDLAKTIVSFANTFGGKIFIGVSDEGEFIGLNESVNELMRRIDDIAYNRCRPPITILQETVNIDDKTILVVSVPMGSQKPYSTDTGRYYIRSANRNRIATREELLRLFQSSQSINIDEIEIENASLKDFDLEYAKKFIEEYFKLSITEEEITRTLKNINALSENEKPTLAGMLFFGINPQKFYPNFRVVAAYIDGFDISTPPSDNKNIMGKIFEILNDTMRFIKIYIQEKHIIKDLEKEKYPLIEDYVIREALVNCIAHRDYTIQAPIRIIIFKDRIEFHSPGKLPNSVSIESIKIGGAHVPRNPTIYNLLGKMGLVTDLGSGIKRIIESVKKTVGEEPRFQIINESEFVLIIPKIKTHNQSNVL